MPGLRALSSILLPLLAAFGRAQDAPRHVLFTWQGDTGTTLTVHFQNFAQQPLTPRVYWDTEPRGGLVAEYRRRTDGTSHRIPGLNDRWVHRVQLEGLEPGATIHLVAGNPVTGLSREYKVRTIPHDDRPLRFVTGGDMGPWAETRVLLRHAARTKPDFALIGGDIAYANGRLEDVDNWDSWLTYWTEEMVTPDGFAVPVVLGIGNHEVDGGFGQKPEKAPFYFGFFAQDPRSYFTRRFGANLVCFILDSGHVAEHGGAQALWLDQALQAHREVPFKAALYHVPLYPSHRDFEGEGSKAGRAHWAPLFDRHGLTVAFENHDHTWKRTAPLRANRVVRDGVLYLGDGCFGVAPRTVAQGGRWYLRRQATLHHFWQVEVSRAGMVYRAVDLQGRVFDVYPEDAPGAAEAAAVLAAHGTRFAMPQEAVTVTPLAAGAATWSAGTTRVSVHNRFAAPILANVSVIRAPAGARAVEGEAVRIAPGASAQIEVRLRVATPIPAKEAIFTLRVHADVLAEGRPRDAFVGDFAVPLAR
ncbi:MAG: metallophosphoesterase family protein [Planctomycetes bacterium]|nr:metallophosphoesterase family protein [Planctomycetota bacterium]